MPKGALNPQYVTVTIPEPVINSVTLPDGELSFSVPPGAWFDGRATRFWFDGLTFDRIWTDGAP